MLRKIISILTDSKPIVQNLNPKEALRLYGCLLTRNSGLPGAEEIGRLKDAISRYENPGSLSPTHAPQSHKIYIDCLESVQKSLLIFFDNLKKNSVKIFDYVDSSNHCVFTKTMITGNLVIFKTVLSIAKKQKALKLFSTDDHPIHRDFSLLLFAALTNTPIANFLLEGLNLLPEVKHQTITREDTELIIAQIPLTDITGNHSKNAVLKKFIEDLNKKIDSGELSNYGDFAEIIKTASEETARTVHTNLKEKLSEISKKHFSGEKRELSAEELRRRCHLSDDEKKQIRERELDVNYQEGCQNSRDWITQCIHKSNEIDKTNFDPKSFSCLLEAKDFFLNSDLNRPFNTLEIFGLLEEGLNSFQRSTERLPFENIEKILSKPLNFLGNNIQVTVIDVLTILAYHTIERPEDSLDYEYTTHCTKFYKLLESHPYFSSGSFASGSKESKYSRINESINFSFLKFAFHIITIHGKNTVDSNKFIKNLGEAYLKAIDLKMTLLTSENGDQKKLDIHNLMYKNLHNAHGEYIAKLFFIGSDEDLVEIPSEDSTLQQNNSLNSSAMKSAPQQHNSNALNPETPDNRVTTEGKKGSKTSVDTATLVFQPTLKPSAMKSTTESSVTKSAPKPADTATTDTPVFQPAPQPSVSKPATQPSVTKSAPKQHDLKPGAAPDIKTVINKDDSKAGTINSNKPITATSASQPADTSAPATSASKPVDKTPASQSSGKPAPATPVSQSSGKPAPATPASQPADTSAPATSASKPVDKTPVSQSSGEPTIGTSASKPVDNKEKKTENGAKKTKLWKKVLLVVALSVAAMVAGLAIIHRDRIPGIMGKLLTSLKEKKQKLADKTIPYIRSCFGRASKSVKKDLSRS